MIFGKWIRHTQWWPNYIARLFKKGFVLWPKEIHAGPVCRGKILTLPSEESSAILHKSIGSISEFVEKTNKYTSYEKELFKNRKFKTDDMFSYYEKEFAYRFFDEKGYLDGLHGFFLSKLMEYYKFLELAKYWERMGYKNIVESEDLKTAVKKHLAKTAQMSEAKYLNEKVRRLSNDLKIIQSAKAYKAWQFYCRLRDRLLK